MLCIIATKGEGEGRGIGEGKKKEEEKDFHGTNGVQLVSQLSFISSLLFFFFIPLQMQIADYLPIVTLDRV